MVKKVLLVWIFPGSEPLPVHITSSNRVQKSFKFRKSVSPAHRPLRHSLEVLLVLVSATEALIYIFASLVGNALKDQSVWDLNSPAHHATEACLGSTPCDGPHLEGGSRFPASGAAARIRQCQADWTAAITESRCTSKFSRIEIFKPIDMLAREVV